jgi:hypothetical protein
MLFNTHTRNKMTMAAESVIRPRVGRKQRWDEAHGARFVTGTLARIDAVLRPRTKDKPPEYRTDFIATAVEKELRRREAKRKGGKS